MLSEWLSEPSLVYIAIIFLIVIAVQGKRRRQGRLVNEDVFPVLTVQPKRIVPQIIRQKRSNDWLEMGLVKQMRSPRR